MRSLSPSHLSPNHYELCVFGGSLGRERPLLADALLELASEECLLHAAVDDAPRQHLICCAVAKDIEVGIDAGIGDRAPPITAVGFGGLDGGRDPPIAEGEQCLVKGMPLRL